MSDSIFLVRPNHELIEAVQAPYALERDLQELLAEHVQLLPGGQIDRINPRRWQLVKREAGVPNEEGGGAWWAVDHLFVDQDAVPTFVEVKRSNDLRIRREVVAQMLEYAANGTAYWRAETLRGWYDEHAGSSEKGATMLAEWLRRNDEVPEEVAEEFWSRVEVNLRDSNVRCIFVADEIPPTLQRLVEFLNEQLRRVQVLAVEVRQYEAGSDGTRAIVPRVIGATAAAAAIKTGASTPQRRVPWTVEEVCDDIRHRLPGLAWIPERVVAWAKSKEGMILTGGKGLNYRSFTVTYDTHRTKGPRERGIFMVQAGPDSYATLEVRLRRMRTTPPYRTNPGRQEFTELIRGIGSPRLAQALQANESRPNLPLADINEAGLEHLLSLCDQWCRAVRQHTDDEEEEPADDL